MKQLIGKLMRGPRMQIYRGLSIDEIFTVWKYPCEVGGRPDARGWFSLWIENRLGYITETQLRRINHKTRTNFRPDEPSNHGVEFSIKHVYQMAEVEDTRLNPTKNTIYQLELLVYFDPGRPMRVGAIYSTLRRVGHLFFLEEGDEHWDTPQQIKQLSKELSEMKS